VHSFVSIGFAISWQDILQLLRWILLFLIKQTAPTAMPNVCKSQDSHCLPRPLGNPLLCAYFRSNGLDTSW